MKEMIMFSSSIIFMLLQMSLFTCKEIGAFNDDIKYDDLNYKEKRVFNLTSDSEQFIYLKMEAEKILSDKYAYFYVYIEEPTKYEFFYKFEKEGENNNFTQLKTNMVTNHGSSHTVYHKMKKPTEEGNTLYLKMRVYNYIKGQKIKIESSETQTDLFLVLSIVIYALSFGNFCIVALSLYCLYKKAYGSNPYDSGDNFIVARVKPEHYQ